MTYCDVDDIKNEFKDIDFESESSQVTTAKVENFLLQSAGKINSYISNQYKVPVSSTDKTVADAFNMLKAIQIAMVADRIKVILEVKDVKDEVNQGVRTNKGTPLWQKELEDIRDGKILLLNVPGASEDGGVASFVRDSSFERTFKRGQNQW